MGMKRGSLIRAIIAGLVAAGALLPTAAHADSTNGDIFYTVFGGSQQGVLKRHYDFDGTTLTYSNDTVISLVGGGTGLGGADGLVFDPTNSNFLLVGGQNKSIYRVDIGSGLATASSATTNDNFHLAITPDGASVLGMGEESGGGGNVGKVALTPFNSSVTNFTVAGNDTVLTGIAYVGSQGYYAASPFTGNGSFGTFSISGSTLTTTRLFSNIPAAHGLAFDPFTGNIMLSGANEIRQYDPISNTFIGQLNFGSNVFDQGAADGKGHYFAASNTGNMLFLDYDATNDIDTATFTDIRFFHEKLDDVAPLSGLGAQNPIPEPASLILFGLGGLAAFGRSSRKQSTAAI